MYLVSVLCFSTSFIGWKYRRRLRKFDDYACAKEYFLSRIEYYKQKSYKDKLPYVLRLIDLSSGCVSDVMYFIRGDVRYEY